MKSPCVKSRGLWPKFAAIVLVERGVLVDAELRALRDADRVVALREDPVAVTVLAEALPDNDDVAVRIDGDCGVLLSAREECVGAELGAGRDRVEHAPGFESLEARDAAGVRLVSLVSMTNGTTHRACLAGEGCGNDGSTCGWVASCAGEE